MRAMYYDPDGRPITLERWVQLQDEDLRRIAETHVDLPGGGRAWVSTVWLGLDHNWAPKGPPLIFETMVFWEDGNFGSDDYCERTPTRVAALAAHDQAVEWTRNLGLVP